MLEICRIYDCVGRLADAAHQAFGIGKATGEVLED
jgi:hypothetical protein